MQDNVATAPKAKTKAPNKAPSIAKAKRTTRTKAAPKDVAKKPATEKASKTAQPMKSRKQKDFETDGGVLMPRPFGPTVKPSIPKWATRRKETEADPSSSSKQTQMPSPLPTNAQENLHEPDVPIFLSKTSRYVHINCRHQFEFYPVINLYKYLFLTKPTAAALSGLGNNGVLYVVISSCTRNINEMGRTKCLTIIFRYRYNKSPFHSKPPLP